MVLEKMNMWKYGQTNDWYVLKLTVLRSVKKYENIQWYYVLTPQNKKKNKKRFSYTECSISIVTCDQSAMSLGKGHRTFWYW